MFHAGFIHIIKTDIAYKVLGKYRTAVSLVMALFANFPF